MLGTTLLDRYRLEAVIGQGGMGTVFRAQDLVLDRAVAVKLLNETQLGTQGRNRLLHEARAAAQLNHPNIVSIYDAGEIAGVSFIVMELVPGRSLYEAWPLPPGAILDVARQICAALEHAHGHGIIHRDLKLENILVAEEAAGGPPLIKLTDFGLARSLASRLTQEGGLIGTVFYLAPEIALGQPADGRADLYSLGVLLYELTTGKLPFTGDDPLAVISQHLHAPLVPPHTHVPDLPPALEALICQLLAKQPDERPASAAAVRARLEQIGRGEAAAGPADPHRSLLDHLARGRLVGREREAAELRAHWTRAVGGAGHVLLLSGEPGIGKTRLVQELRALAEVSGGRVLAGECYAEGGAPYGPITQILRPILLDSPPAEVRAPAVLSGLLTLVPDLRPVLAPEPAARGGRSLEPQAEQSRVFESFVALCAALTAEQPLLLCIEDVHWADSGTLFLLRHLARRLRRQRLLLVFTYRETDLDQACCLPEVLVDLNRERLSTRLKLGRFSLDGTRALLAALLQGPVSDALAAAVHHETEGNPFFVEEVCKTLVEESRLSLAEGSWQAAGLDEIIIPQSVRVTLQARVAKLPEPAQDALRLAAVLGRDFDFETLARASDLDEEALIAALEAAEHAQLIVEARRTGRAAFSFAHALIPSALREGVSRLRRQRLHRRAGL
ncbi:MAG: protein kinase, partial [Anaerolineales bacterium]|nr:protein kinase [Anaerolineales bacterium]